MTQKASQTAGPAATDRDVFITIHFQISWELGPVWPDGDTARTVTLFSSRYGASR